MATILVLSLGSKFIPKWRDANLKFTFKKFEDKEITKQNVFFGNCTSTFCFETGTSKLKIGYGTKIRVNTDKNLGPTNAD